MIGNFGQQLFLKENFVLSFSDDFFVQSMHAHGQQLLPFERSFLKIMTPKPEYKLVNFRVSRMMTMMTTTYRILREKLKVNQSMKILTCTKDKKQHRFSEN